MKQVADTAPRLSSQEAVYLDQINAILRQALRGRPCQVYLFGSRAGGHATAGSDFDVAVLSDEDLSSELSVARERLNESNIPYKVDVVDLRSASPAFRQHVLAQGVLLWKN